MNETTDTQIIEYARSAMNNKALDTFRELGRDEELGPVDSPTVQQFITCLTAMKEEDRTCHCSISVNENEQHRKDKEDIRLRLLNGVQVAYWTMPREGRITQTATILLMQSIDEAIDMVDSPETLHDWEWLEAYALSPNYFKYLQMRSLSQKIGDIFQSCEIGVGLRHLWSISSCS